jgi:ABC-2 type transport system permease protein
MARLAQCQAAAAALTTGMFGDIFRWEIRALRRDPACWAVLVLAVITVVFAMFNGARWLAHIDAVAAAAAARDATARLEAREQAARIDAKAEPTPFMTRDPRSALGYANGLMAHYAVLPPTPLAALTAGQSDLLPSVLPLAPANLPSPGGGSEPENPRRLLAGRFDAAFAVVFVFPLIVIALTYALLAGERERGTLALLLAQPLTLPTLLAAKLAPRMLIEFGLLGLLAALFIVALAILNVPGGVGARLALWLAVALSYMAFWFALAAAVVSRRGSSATHAATLVALWLASGMLLPTGMNLAVKTLAPMPSRIELILALRAATDAATAERSELLSAFYEDHPELASARSLTGDFVTLQLVTRGRVEHDLAPVLARYQQQLAHQQALLAKLQFLSPALLAQTAFAESAGTGLSRHHRFFEQAMAHHAQLRVFLMSMRCARRTSPHGMRCRRFGMSRSRSAMFWLALPRRSQSLSPSRLRLVCGRGARYLLAPAREHKRRPRVHAGAGQGGNDWVHCGFTNKPTRPAAPLAWNGSAASAAPLMHVASTNPLAAMRLFT